MITKKITWQTEITNGQRKITTGHGKATEGNSRSQNGILKSFATKRKRKNDPVEEHKGLFNVTRGFWVEVVYFDVDKLLHSSIIMFNMKKSENRRSLHDRSDLLSRCSATKITAIRKPGHLQVALEKLRSADASLNESEVQISATRKSRTGKDALLTLPEKRETNLAGVARAVLSELIQRSQE